MVQVGAEILEYLRITRDTVYPHRQSLSLKDLKVTNNLQGGLYIKRDCIVQYVASTYLLVLVKGRKLYQLPILR